MSPKEIKTLIKTLRAAGITHYKTPELELKIDPIEPRRRMRTKPTDESEIKHKVEELTSLLKLSDQDLVDRLFPDHTLEEPIQEEAN